MDSDKIIGEGITFDDVLLIPARSDFDRIMTVNPCESREQVYRISLQAIVVAAKLSVIKRVLMNKICPKLIEKLKYMAKRQ